MSKQLKMRIEEYVPAGQFLMVSFVRDRAELANRFSEFTPEYLTGFSDQLTKVKKLEQSVVLSEKQKQVTAALYDVADGLSGELNFLSFHLKRAGLDTSLVTKVKYDINKRNIEGACQKLEGMLQYVVEQQALLVSKGMSADFPVDLEGIINDLEAKNALQNEVMDKKDQLHERNREDFKTLYGFISTISAAGKVMYDGKVKEDEYTISKIVGRMRSSKVAEAEVVNV
jgi:hypothetical protein